MRTTLFIVFLFYCLALTDAWKHKHKCTKTVYKFRPHKTHTTTRKVTAVTAPCGTKTVTDFTVETTDTVSTIQTTFTPEPATTTTTLTSTSISTSVSTDVTLITETATTVDTTTATTTTTTTTYTESYSYSSTAPAASAAIRFAKKQHVLPRVNTTYVKFISGPIDKRSLPSFHHHYHQKCKTVTHWIDHTKIKTKTIKVASGKVTTTVRPTTTTTETTFATTTISLDQATDTITTTTITTTDTDTTTTSPTTTISSTTTTTTTTATSTETVANFPFCSPDSFESNVILYIQLNENGAIASTNSTAADCCQTCGNTDGCVNWQLVTFNNYCVLNVLNDPSQCGTNNAVGEFGPGGNIGGTTPCAGVTPFA